MENNKKVVTIIDTFGFFFRSYYALPPLTNRSGFPTGLLTGFINFITSLHKEHSSDYLIFALDAPGASFRASIDPLYKANRAPAPEELKKQLPVAIDWINKMGYKSLMHDGFEADDIIASVVHHAREQGHLVRVVSHDKDLYQLIDDDKVVLVDAISKKVMNEKHCMEKYGVSVHQFIDYQSLIGDTADNVPGVKGIGKVTAQKLLSQFHSLDGLYSSLNEVTPPRIKGLLEMHQEDAFRSRELVRLRDDVFASVNFDDYVMHYDDPFISIYDELVHYEMNAILRTLKAKALFEDQQTSQRVKMPPEASSTDVSLFSTSSVVTTYEYICLDTSEKLFAIVNSIPTESIIAFDIETSGLDSHADSLVGFSFSWEESKAYYVPIAHNYLGVGQQIDLSSAKQVIQTIFEHKIIGHNLKFDLHFIWNWLDNKKILIADTMVLAWLIDSSRSLSLDNLSLALLDHEMIHFKDTVKKGDNFASVSIEEATQYAAEDALMTYRLYNLLLKQFIDIYGNEGLNQAEQVEFPFVLTLLNMEKEGIRIDIQQLEAFKEEVSLEIKSLTEQIHDLAGSIFNINSPKQLGSILFEVLELPHGKKTKTGYSTDENVLESLKNDHSIVPLLLQYREYHKLFSTYIEPLIALAKRDQSSRIYTSFVQTGTATGRLSSKNPNLQNIPVKTSLGQRIREAFVASEGKLLIGIDYSQIELRLLAHFSNDSVLVNAFQMNRDIHMETAIALFGEMEAASKRHIAKTVNFGLLYGMGSKKLSDTLGISTKEAKEIIERYFQAFPSIKGYFATIVNDAKEKGYVETLLKRRRNFDFATATPMLKAAYEREAVNTVFQGSASDLIKLSMNEIQLMIENEKLKGKMLLQIHDELVFEVDESEASSLAERFSHTMENIFKLNIPLKTSVNIGKHWGELK